jgi:pSer/pThr/pTyr-binding forkhead associated (FHA) protein
MAVPCPHCKTKLQDEEIQETVTGGRVCPHCQRALDEPPSADAPAPAPSADSPSTLAELPADKAYTLEVLDGNEPGQVFPLEKIHIVIGRRGCDVNLDDPEISRQHVSIDIHGTNATLLDLGSTNGTYIQGQRVDRGDLKDNSEFRVGTHQLVFRVTYRAPSKS